MTEIYQKPTLGPAMGRRKAVQDAYQEHVWNKQERGDTSCDMCRLSAEQTLGFGVLDIVTKTAPGVSIVANSFPYRVHNGQEVLQHDLLIPDIHLAELKDFPSDLRDAFYDTYTNAMNEYDESFIRSPTSDGSSIKNHAHMHLVKFGRRVVEQHYSLVDNVNTVRFKGNTELEDI